VGWIESRICTLKEIAFFEKVQAFKGVRVCEERVTERVRLSFLFELPQGAVLEWH
jgi:hypothetical protein